MKRLLSTLLFLCVAVFYAVAQVPQKMSYQAVVRNNNNALVTNTQVGVRISIMQNSAQGSPVYVETQTPFTNANGLFSIEIGGGTVVFGNFSSINWSAGTYYIKNEVDIAGGTNYSISGTSQLVSVPYALHAKTAESFSGTMNETDPIFSASPSAGITAPNITSWTNKQDALTAGPGIAITNNVIQATGVGGSEVDPIFSASPASGITSPNITSWNNKQDQLVAGTNITISGNTISAGSGSGLFTHYIGELYGGGIVVGVWMSGGVEHGLIASLVDLSTSSKWSNVATAIGTSAQDVINGNGNTLAIEQQVGHTESAALLCDAYVAGGFSDWYLPTYWELKMCYNSSFIVNTILGNANGFKPAGIYWSSVEVPANKAWRIPFTTGVPIAAAKTSLGYVRAVRQF